MAIYVNLLACIFRDRCSHVSNVSVSARMLACTQMCVNPTCPCASPKSRPIGFGSPRDVSCLSRRLSLYAKSNRKPGTEAPEPACAGRMRLQHSPGMVGTTVWEQRLCETGILRSPARTTGTTLRVSRSDDEDRRLPRSRPPFPYLVAARSEAPARPCPTPSASSLRDSTSRSAAQFASGAFRRV